MKRYDCAFSYMYSKDLNIIDELHFFSFYIKLLGVMALPTFWALCSTNTLSSLY